MLVRWIETVATREVGTTHGKRQLEEKRFAEADIQTIDQLIAIAREHCTDRSFRFVPSLDELMMKAAVCDAIKHRRGRRPKGEDHRPKQNAMDHLWPRVRVRPDEDPDDQGDVLAADADAIVASEMRP